MRSHTIREFLIFGCMMTAVGVWLAASTLARADQIVLVDDGHGHMVYVNIGDPPTLTRSRGHSLRPVAPPPEIEKLVRQSAERHQVDPKLVRAIIQVESDYDTDAVSNKGAMGLMQLIPSTAQRFGVQNPFNAGQNIEGGVNYLRHLLDLFHGDLTLSLAAYNAGPRRVLNQGGVPPISETVNYVRKVKSLYEPGSDEGPLRTGNRQAKSVPVFRYVDAHGVVHFTDGSDL